MMMQSEDQQMTDLLETIVENLGTPASYYKKAAERHRSLGEWLCRPESKVAVYKPHVSAQGSFRYGTVNMPLEDDEEYDLDNVTMLNIPKTGITQKELKQLYGSEIKAYARAHGILAPVEEKNRCWRLVYADEVKFHLDALPCLAEESATISAIVARGVPMGLASRAIAITDKRHPQYERITRYLVSSNPRGFAAWFEERVRPLAKARMRQLVEKKLYASVEDVPPYEWKTPLQQSIQLLKRHRDTMFRKTPSRRPISMIITNLAAQAYAGETDVWSAVRNVTEKIPSLVNPTRPRVPNPADPAEDYADKWFRDPSLEENFWAWHAQLKIDLNRLLKSFAAKTLFSEAKSAFCAELSKEQLRKLQPSGVATIRGGAPISITSAPRPWGVDE
jgi:hypothetical protein